MALNHSPSIVTNGLVFAYDMSNSQKSWKGAPTTNLLQSTNFTTGWAGYCGSTSNVTYNTLDTTAPDESYTALKHVRGSETGCGAGGSWGLLHSLASAMTVGQPYTISVWAKTNGPSFSVTLGHNDAAGTGISLNSQWQRFSFTYTPGNTTRGFQFINGNLNTTTYWWNPQCEISTFATPFVAGTRLANNNLEATPSYPTWNILSGSSYSAGTLTFAAGSYNSKGGWDLYKTYSGLSTATNYTWSALVKLGTATNFLVTMNNTSAWNTGPSAQFNLGQLSTTSWTRVSITGTTNTGSFNIHLGASANSELAATIQSGGTVFLQDVRLELTGSQTALVDLTGNNTIAATSLTYASDGTFSFNGTDSYLDCGSNALIKPTSAITVSTWIKFTSAASNNRILSDWHQIGGSADRWIFYNDTATTLKWYMNSVGQAEGGTASYTFTPNSWINLVGTYDGINQILYVNGTQFSSVPRTGLMGAGTGYTVRIGKQAETGGAHSGSIGTTTIHNRALSAIEVQQNFNALKMRYYGENSEVPATSGYDLKSVRPNLPSGYYWIKNNSMPNALRMYVDMSEEGGGYDFYPIQGTGTSIGFTNGIHSGIALGLDLVYPRSKQHWIAMSNFVRNVLGSTGNEYFTTVYSVHRETSGGAGSRGGNYTGDIMRNPAFYASGAPDWKVPDGGRWWLRDTTFGEPNGDYTAYNFLGGYTFPNPYTGQDLSFNDVTGQTYTTGTYYLVSTNAKP